MVEWLGSIHARQATVTSARAPAARPIATAVDGRDGCRMVNQRPFIRARSASAAMNPNAIQFDPATMRSKTAFAWSFFPL